ncbi:MAG: hypothetical protein IT558_02670 [Alphaproteobacteria bacterium]|nr:hypothetical protein [Alphaproteobacteria bacterium]
MAFLTPAQGVVIVALFGLASFAVTWLTGRGALWTSTRSGFLYAGRSVSYIPAAFSIAASWIWAPALFVSVQKSYELGLAGLFWFTAPNVVAVIVYAFLGPAIRKKLPGGFSIPDWMYHRFHSEGDKISRIVHRLYLVPYIWYQVMAITVQLFVGGMLLNFLTGIPVHWGMGLMLAVVLSYALISGLRASIVTDFLQMSMILIGIAVVMPWTLSVTGWEGVAQGFAGIKGIENVLDPGVAFSFGIVTSLGLIAGSISDQQFWQRCFAIRPDQLVPSFILAGLLFAVVPLGLSVLGFAAANPDFGIMPPEGTGLPMIGVQTVAKLLPSWVMIVFVVMLLAGLASTLDSGLMAGASLYAIDMQFRTLQEQEILRKQRLGISLSAEEEQVRLAHEKEAVRLSRYGALGIAVIGLIVAIIVQHLFPLDRLWWVFNGVATMFVVPTVLSIFWDRLSARGVIAGLAAASIGMVFFVYGNYIQNDVITVYSALGIIAVNIIFCLLLKRDMPWTGTGTH